MPNGNGGVRVTHAFPSAFVTRQQERAKSKGADYPFSRKETLEDVAAALGWPDSKSLQHRLKSDGERGKHVHVGSMDAAPSANGHASALEHSLAGVSGLPAGESVTDMLALRDSRGRRVAGLGGVEEGGWCDLVYAPAESRDMGEAFLERKVLAFLNEHARARPDGSLALPQVSHVTARPPTAAHVNLLREALPEARKGEAAIFRLSDSRDQAVNPFDLPLGARHPVPHHRAFLGRFLELILVSRAADLSQPRENAEMMLDLVDKLYERAAGKDPNIYSQGDDAEVDEALARIGCASDDQALSWWEIVDALFGAGETRAAERAQRQAVPRLADVASLLKNGTLYLAWREARTTHGENLLAVVERKLSTALREFPSLDEPTRAEVPDASVLSVDVSGFGGEHSPTPRRKSVAYMVGRAVAARGFADFGVRLGHLRKAGDACFRHHAKRVGESRDASPRLLALQGFDVGTLERPAADDMECAMTSETQAGRRTCVATDNLGIVSTDVLDKLSGAWLLGLRRYKTVCRALETFNASAVTERVMDSLLAEGGDGDAPVIAVTDTHEGVAQRVCRFRALPFPASR